MDSTTDIPFENIVTLQHYPQLCNISSKGLGCSVNIINGTEAIQKTESYLERSLGFLVIGIIGIVANLFVISILGSSVKVRQKLVNTLIIHQSILDLFSSIALVGTAHLSLGDQHGLKGLLADIYCFFVLSKWPLWFMMLTSSYSLMFLNIERYISIIFPIFHHTKVTRTKVLMLLPIVWILGLLEECLVASSFVEIDGTCKVGSTYYHIKMIWITLIYYIVLHFFLPVLLVLFLYGHMIIRLRNSVNSKFNATSNKRGDVMEKAKNNIFKTMLFITICYAVCYAFNSIYIALFLPGILPSITGQFYSFTVYMVCANSIVNPFVYVIQYHEFQNRVKEIFCRKQDSPEVTSGITGTVSMDSVVK